MTTPYLVRFYHPQHGIRIGVQLEDTVHDITERFPTIGDWLSYSLGQVEDAIAELEDISGVPTYSVALLENAPVEHKANFLAPTDRQDIWAAGVTYERSREARQEESEDGGDIYARVYSAARPELFFKANGRRAVGHLDYVGIRSDATWSVPEPELAVVMNAFMEVVGFTIGNDMSSRDIEGANPLYLPQAKVYTASCALGRGIMLYPMREWPEAGIYITIQRGGQAVFRGETHTSRIKRSLSELIAYLGRSNTYPEGVVLLTGTGTVPPNDFTLQAGDVITIRIDEIGSLQNTVKVV